MIMLVSDDSITLNNDMAMKNGEVEGRVVIIIILFIANLNCRYYHRI